MEAGLWFLYPSPNYQLVLEALHIADNVPPVLKKFGSPATKVVRHLRRDSLQLQIAVLRVILRPGITKRNRFGLPKCELLESPHDLPAFRCGAANVAISETNEQFANFEVIGLRS
jgi:hypothetical protein